jgi:hypothetical protein
MARWKLLSEWPPYNSNIVLVVKKLVFELCINISEYAIQVRVYCASRTVTNAEEVLQVHPDKEL